MLNSTRYSQAACAAALLPLMALGDLAAAQVAVGPVCAERNAATRTMTIVLSGGCVSSSQPYRGQTFTVKVDQQTARIVIAGKFNYDPGRSASGTSDCQNAKTATLNVADTAPRRYSVEYNGRYIGVVDFTATGARSCPREERRSLDWLKRQVEPASADQRYAAVDVAAWKPSPAASLTALLAPILRGHPESLEGRPSLKLAAHKEISGKGLIVEIEMLGYLDDAVAGEQFLGFVEHGANGWVMRSLWKRSLCARGASAGQWTGKPCL
jgi:hypothetical protein